MVSTTARADWPERVRRIALISLLAVAVLQATTGQASPAASPPTRVTVIGDSIATAVQYQPEAHSLLSRGIELDLQLAVCRRLVGDSCPYEGSKPPTLVELLPSLRLGSTVVVAVGYNDFEPTFAASVETALQALDNAGVEHVLWLTLRAERQSYLNMNDVVRAAGLRHPNLTVVDWNLYSRSHPDWFQPDGLHLTDVGAIAMATLLHSSLDELGLVAAPEVKSLRIVTKRLPTARVGRTYVARLTATGGSRPVNWDRKAGAIPSGLRLSRDGRLTGIPRVAGRRLITLGVTDLDGRSATRRFLLTISANAGTASGKPPA
jgi:hypothetical protein